MLPADPWSGLLTRMRASDFRLRTQFGLLSDWPIDYSDLDPYYCESEQLLSALEDIHKHDLYFGDLRLEAEKDVLEAPCPGDLS